VNVFVGPSQVIPPLAKCGVTTIVATTGTVPVLVAVKDIISSVPLAGNPIPGISFVHEYKVVPTVLSVLKLIAVVAEPLQTT